MRHRLVPLIPLLLLAPVATLAADLVPATLDASERVAVVECSNPRVQPALRAAGLDLLAPHGAAAFLVRGSEPELAAARQVAGVLGARELGPKDRVGARARELVRQPGDAPRLRVTFLPGTDAEAWRELLAATPGAKILSLHSGAWTDVALLSVQGPEVAAALDHLSRLRDVLDVAPAPFPKPAIDHAIWWLQSGDDVVADADYSISAPLFAKGLTGRGLLLGVADDGLENDDCHFRYGAGIAEVGWPLGPSAGWGGGGSAAVPNEEAVDALHPAPLRTRDRKVVAYYLQDGAAPYGNPIQHGTPCAGVAVGDRPDSLAARPLVRDLGERQDVAPWRPGGAWSNGQDLRPDLAARVDDPTTDDPALPNTFGGLVEHHAHADGVAPGAQIVFQDLADAGGAFTFTTSVGALVDQASRTGATTWLGAWGWAPCADCYLGEAQDLDEKLFFRRDVVAVASAGNDATLGIARGTAQAKSAICVGGTVAANEPSCGACPSWTTTRLGEAMAPFSSQGVGAPLLPLLVAPAVMDVGGLGALPVQPEDGSGSGNDDCGGPALGPQALGTSLSASAVAGLSLLVQQYFLDGFYSSGLPTPRLALRPTSALVRAVLVNSARDLLGAGTGPGGTQAHRPNRIQGWGAPRLDDTLYFDGDPTPLGDGTDTERARLLVLTDTPNGFDRSYPLVPEPGGRTRDQIVASFRPALADRAEHAFSVKVLPPAGSAAPDELRFTMSYADVPGTSATGAIVNDLDLEVVSPGPDGIFESGFGLLVGDDVLYRCHPDTEWEGGFSRRSTDTQLLLYRGDASRPGKDGVNTVENVFVRPDEAVAGTWLVRVVASSVRGVGGTNQGWPNYALLDTAATRDTDGDGAPDIDEFDVVRGDLQGYALIASGNVEIPSLLRPYVPRRPPVFRPPTRGPGRPNPH